jgi:hypothetical protein
MKIEKLFGILAACAAGYIGGLLSSQIPARASPPDVVRAARFELVNGSGVPTATWEADPSGESRLSFLHGHDTVGVDIGVLSDGRPFLRMRGRDGKNRIVMTLDQTDKPMLGMGDEQWEGRVHLGFMPPDTFPYSNWDHWGLVFRASGSPVAVIGMAKTGNNPIEGFLTVAGKKIR